MKFFVDEHLPLSLAGWLRGRGHDAEHVDDLGLWATPDADISLLVAEAGGVIVTKDSDFLDLRRRNPRFQVLWIRTGNGSTKVLLQRLEGAWPLVLAALQAGEPVVEVR